ncbi:MAG TPA: peptidoglycan DD-metalloendopeptidase family protein, partial [Candidatus Limnocylindrales bacterium]|nr:peptidoglycan DD-metalloendopeptidase family protein [Candidatus Limnocylindrales bacterium]
MPDAHRAHSDRPRRPALRSAAAAILAVPVIGLVIAESLARRVGQPALVLVLLLTSTAAVSAVSMSPITASHATTPTPIPADQFRPVGTPDPTARPTQQPVVAALPPAGTPAPTAEATPAPEAPNVIRFRPRDGWTEVSRFAAVSVRFSEAMDHASTERAFRVTVNRKPVTGTVRWAEGDTVLVVDPDRPLPYRSRVTLSVDRGARSADGARLKPARSVTFTVQSRPAPISRPTPKPTPRPTARTGWRWPLIGPITQRFGEHKTKYGFHQGIDIDGQTGDRVRAARGGRVILAGYADACGGLQVRIDHGDGFESWYRHLSRIEVKRGAVVAAGNVIGRV